MSKRTLVVAECDGEAITEATLRVVNAATQCGQSVDVLITSPRQAGAASHIAGIERVLVAQMDESNDGAPETLATLLATLSPQYSLFAASHRSLGRSALPRAAALCDGAFLADVTAVLDQTHFVRNLYAGSVVATVETLRAVTFATFRTSSFAAVASDGGTSTIVQLPPPAPFRSTTLIERQASGQAGQDLASARVIVSGGRGLGSKENMERLAAFADSIGAALGASRAAVDAGYVSNAAQIGQTGKTVAPDLYVAFGISGAIQHLAGMKDSKIIVAVNKDPDAPIFSVADYGVVGDLFDVLSQLEATVSRSNIR